MVKFKCSVRLDDDRKTLRRSENGFIGIERKGQIVNFVVKFSDRILDVFNLKERFREIHKRFINDGKLTIIFHSPCRKVMIQSKSQQLKKLLHEMSKELPDKLKDLISPEELKEINASCSNSSGDTNQKKMKIDTMEHYKRAMKKFPPSLEVLEITSIGLATINMQWFSLINLNFLLLSGNSFDKLNATDWKIFCNIKKLENLSHLDLSNCKLNELPLKFVRSLPRSLQCLDIQENNLKILPEEISDLHQLNYLSVAKNPDLETLPNDLFFNCTKLIIFKASETKLTSHPAILRNFKFRLFSSSAIGREFVQPTVPKSKPPSLISVCSAKAYDMFYRTSNHKKERILHLLPPILQPLLNELTFRCDRCRLRYPKEFVGQSLIQPIPVRWIAELVEQEEGAEAFLPLLDMLCKICHQRDERSGIRRTLRVF